MSRLRLRIGRAEQKTLVCYGDSLTAGVGATGVKQQWVPIVANRLGRAAYNGGVGGETSSQILTRIEAEAEWTGYGGDDVIRCFWLGRNNYSSGAQVQSDIAVAVAAFPAGSKYLVLSICNGEYSNEYTGQSGHTAMVALNASLAATYGDRYLDVRSYLVGEYDPNTPQDVTDYGRDIVPSTLRADNIHHNDSGQGHVADCVHAKIIALGWG